jgi:AcrR family transcriptional regulator
MGQSTGRARRPEQKAERRQQILAAARDLLGEVPYGELRMAGLAGRLGLAKGTPYLYFATKESLFIALLEEELSAWFDQVDGALAGGGPGPARLPGMLSRTVAGRPLLRRLLVLLHGVLEENVGLAEARAFKRFLLARVTFTGSRLEAALPGLGSGGGARLLLRLHALVIGAQSMSDASPVVRRVLRDEALSVLDVDFEPFLGSALADLLAGATRARRPRKKGNP